MKLTYFLVSMLSQFRFCLFRCIALPYTTAPLSTIYWLFFTPHPVHVLPSLHLQPSIMPLKRKSSIAISIYVIYYVIMQTEHEKCWYVSHVVYLLHKSKPFASRCAQITLLLWQFYSNNCMKSIVYDICNYNCPRFHIHGKYAVVQRAQRWNVP